MTCSQFHAFEPRAVVIVRLQYECRSGAITRTGRATRPASGRSRYLPGIKLVGAVRALLSLLSARVQDANQSTRGLFKRFQFSPCARVFHEGNSSDGVRVCPTPDRANPT
jgi:hypothetical protein